MDQNDQEDTVIQYIKTHDINAYTLLPWSTMTVGEYANQLIASYISKRIDLPIDTPMRPTFYQHTHTNHKKKNHS